MKKSRGTLAIIHVVILCYFISFFYSTSLTVASNSSGSLFSQDESCFLFYSSNLINTSTQPENIIKQVNQDVKAFSKSHFNNFIAPSITSESVLAGIFSKYIFFSRICIIRLQSTDIIFPFHYHW